MVTTIEEGGSFEYGFELVKKNGDPVAKSELESLTMTLYNENTSDVINSRSGVDLLTHADASFGDTNGRGSFKFRSADNPIHDDTLGYETHKALFEAAWGDDDGKKWELEINVRNLIRVMV